MLCNTDSQLEHPGVVCGLAAGRGVARHRDAEPGVRDHTTGQVGGADPLDHGQRAVHRSGGVGHGDGGRPGRRDTHRAVGQARVGGVQPVVVGVQQRLSRGGLCHGAGSVGRHVHCLATAGRQADRSGLQPAGPVDGERCSGADVAVALQHLGQRQAGPALNEVVGNRGGRDGVVANGDADRAEGVTVPGIGGVEEVPAGGGLGLGEGADRRGGDVGDADRAGRADIDRAGGGHRGADPARVHHREGAGGAIGVARRWRTAARRDGLADPNRADLAGVGVGDGHCPGRPVGDRDLPVGRGVARRAPHIGRVGEASGRLGLSHGADGAGGELRGHPGGAGADAEGAVGAVCAAVGAREGGRRRAGIPAIGSADGLSDPEVACGEPVVDRAGRVLAVGQGQRRAVQDACGAGPGARHITADGGGLAQGVGADPDALVGDRRTAGGSRDAGRTAGGEGEVSHRGRPAGDGFDQGQGGLGGVSVCVGARDRPGGNGGRCGSVGQCHPALPDRIGHPIRGTKGLTRPVHTGQPGQGPLVTGRGGLGDRHRLALQQFADPGAAGTQVEGCGSPWRAGHCRCPRITEGGRPGRATDNNLVDSQAAHLGEGGVDAGGSDCPLGGEKVFTGSGIAGRRRAGIVDGRREAVDHQLVGDPVLSQCLGGSRTGEGHLIGATVLVGAVGVGTRIVGVRGLPHRPREAQRRATVEVAQPDVQIAPVARRRSAADRIVVVLDGGQQKGVAVGNRGHRGGGNPQGTLGRSTQVGGAGGVVTVGGQRLGTGADVGGTGRAAGRLVADAVRGIGPGGSLMIGQLGGHPSSNGGRLSNRRRRYGNQRRSQHPHNDKDREPTPQKRSTNHDKDLLTDKGVGHTHRRGGRLCFPPAGCYRETTRGPNAHSTLIHRLGCDAPVP